MDNNKKSWAANYHIMISEGSYNTKDWSNNCRKSNFTITIIKYSWKYIKIEKVILNCNNIFQFLYCVHAFEW